MELPAKRYGGVRKFTTAAACYAIESELVICINYQWSCQGVSGRGRPCTSPALPAGVGCASDTSWADGPLPPRQRIETGAAFNPITGSRNLRSKSFCEFCRNRARSILQTERCRISARTRANQQRTHSLYNEAWRAISQFSIIS
jgi:hypothetical protein